MPLDFTRRHGITEALPPHVREVYEQRGGVFGDELWSFCWPVLSRKTRQWYVPILWDGNSRLAFVAQQPSSRGDFPSNADQIFWDEAVSAGLASDVVKNHGPRTRYGGPFVTELLPFRAPVKLAQSSLPSWRERNERGLRSELEVVKPVLIVAMGDNVFRELRKLGWINVPIERVTHHGVFNRVNDRSRYLRPLRVELARVKRVYERLSGGP